MNCVSRNFLQKGYLDWSVPNQNITKFEKFEEKKQNCDLLYVWNKSLIIYKKNFLFVINLVMISYFFL